MSQFVNYVLTLGQQKAPSFGYASLGLSLEQYGINAVQHNVPGAVPPTAAEQQAYACGDLTPTEVAAGQTTPTCGVVNATAAPTWGQRRHRDRGRRSASATTGPGRRCSAATACGTGGWSSRRRGRRRPFGGAHGSLLHGGHRDQPLPVTVLGLVLFVIGIIGRRRYPQAACRGCPMSGWSVARRGRLRRTWPRS